MSKIGRKLIRIPENIKIFIQENEIILCKETQILKIKKPTIFILDFKDQCLFVKLPQKEFKVREKDQMNMFWGTFRNYLNDAIIGLSQKFQISLKIIGVGYRMFVENNYLCLKVGYSHLIYIKIPSDISISTPKLTKILMQGYNKNSLLQFAALIRSYKIPEPYKGKGIVYKGERVRRKEGKKK